MLLRLFLICIIPLLAGCGYHLGQEGVVSRSESITVPYIAGDVDGMLTAAVIRELTTRGGLDYCVEGGHLTLLAALYDLRDENIGFRYDWKKKGEKKGDLSHSVVPTETRMTAIAEVKVIEACSGCVILGPAYISAYVDFDHDYYSSKNAVNTFSLGQLSDVDEANDAVRQPLFRILAQKITDFVIQSW